MPRKKVTKPKSGLLQTKATDDQWERLIAYCEEHELSASQFGRLAIERALKKKPTNAERDSAIVPVGNPNVRAEGGKFTSSGNSDG